MLFLSTNSHSLVAQKLDLVNYVNTLQGTNSKLELTYGNTYPDIALPFGMNTWSPQTGKNGSGWKYQYFVDSIRGFEQAHQCSSWTNDYAVFSLMPATQLVVNEDKRALHFSHKNEIAKPNYYKVTFENKLTTEVAPTERGAHFRFSFPAKTKSFLIVDGYTKMSGVHIFPKENKITGFV
ncbi:MAG: glycoside hydrolase family 92 protein, partial [Bacteroidota bacterium]|nr:glycoside hydrolase family 92 protein [Bacteroidota bacterium]